MLTVEAQEYARTVLGETDEARKSSIREIQSFIAENSQISDEKFDERTILVFLRGCKFNIEKTKKKISK